jgi:hypothetical protein
MNSVGTVIGTTPAILASVTALATVSVTAGPWQAEYWGDVRAVSLPDVASGTRASITGSGRLWTPATATTFSSTAPVPLLPGTSGTAVAQTATGLVTTVNQYVAAGFTPLGTITTFTSFTCDHLTVELLG